MPDPVSVSLASVGALALTEGVKFFYSQAAEILKWWREKRRPQADEQAAKMSKQVEVVPPPQISGGAFSAKVNPVAVERFEGDLQGLLAELADYGIGEKSVDKSDIALLERVDGLRRVLEAIYGRRISFQGEPGREAGASLSSELEIEKVAGYVAAIRAKEIRGGTVNAKLRVGEVGAGAEAVGIDLTGQT